MLLTDIRLLTNLQIIAESKETNTMKIRGVFQRADEVNNNKRLYPKALMEEHVKEMQSAIKENRLLGELDHPAYDVVKLSNASHKITRLEMQGNDVIGEAVILGTPAGKVAQELIKGGVAIGISSRGTGTLSEGKNGHSVVKEYHGITYDLVADPSTRGAFPSLTESKITDQRKYILDIMKKVHGEKIFVRMIENSLLTKENKESKPMDNLKSKIEEIAQSLKTIKLARAKRLALAKKGFGDKTSTLQKAKNDANPEYQAKMQAKRAPMLKAALDKRKASGSQDNVEEGRTTGGDPHATATRVLRGLPKNPTQDKEHSVKKSKQANRIFKKLDKKHPGKMWTSKQESSEPKADKTYLIMEIFKKFGFKNRYEIAADVKKNPAAPPKKQKKAQKILSKLADRNVKSGFKPKKDDQLGYS